MNNQEMKKLVQKAMNELLYEHSEESVGRNFSENFIQHNPFSADGAEHLMAMTQFTFVWEPARWIIEDDIVAYHGMYTATNPLDPENPLHCVDMWRIEDEKIAEHWDVLDIRPFGQAAALLAGGGDGLKDVPAEQVVSNKANAIRFMDEFVQEGLTSSLSDLLGSTFVHHSEYGEKSSQEMINWLASLGGSIPHEVKKVIGSGDLVLVHSHFTHPQMTVANFDIFRFEGDGKIAEHWSAAQPFATETENPHPHF